MAVQCLVFDSDAYDIVVAAVKIRIDCSVHNHQTTNGHDIEYAVMTATQAS